MSLLIWAVFSGERCGPWDSCLFVCLGFFVPLENFSPKWRRLYFRVGLQIFTYARLSWPLSSDFSLPCQTYCVTTHLFIMVIREILWNSQILTRVFAVNLSLLVFTTKICRGWDSNSQPSTYSASSITKGAITAAIEMYMEIKLQQSEIWKQSEIKRHNWICLLEYACLPII